MDADIQVRVGLNFRRDGVKMRVFRTSVDIGPRGEAIPMFQRLGTDIPPGLAENYRLG